MATKVLWYQRPAFLGFFSFIVAVVLVATTYSWSDLIKQSEQEFVYYYLPKASEGNVVISEPVEVRVIFRGSQRAREELAKETRREIVHEMDEIATLGENSVQIPEPVESSRLTFVRMTPETATVLVDSLTDWQSVVVRADLRGEPAQHHKEDGWRVGASREALLLSEASASDRSNHDPFTVQVRRPSSFDPLVEISTFPVSIQGLNESRIFEEVELDRPEHTFVKGSNKVAVQVKVIPVEETRLFDPVKVELRNVPRGYTVTADPSFISVQALAPVTRTEVPQLTVEIDVRNHLTRDENDAYVEGAYENIEVKLKGLPRWATAPQQRPEKITLHVAAKEPPKAD